MTIRLLLLNGLAVMMVPFHHASAYGLQAMFQWTDRYRDVTVPNYDALGSLPYYVLMIIRQFDAFAIPAFLFVSGFFLAFMARGEDRKLTWSMVTPRIKVLLVPFAIWTTVRIVMLQRPPDSIVDILQPYYFIVLLFQFYLLAPLLVPLAKKNWIALLLVVALLQFTADFARYLREWQVENVVTTNIITFTPLWFFPRRILFFCVGIVFGVHFESLEKWLVRYRWALLGFVVFSGLMTMVEYETVAYVTGQDWLGPAWPGLSRITYALTFSLAFLAFHKSSMPGANTLSWLGSRSLGVYLANIPAIFVAAVLMYRFTPQLLGNQLIYQIVLLVVGLGVPLLLMEGLRRSPARKYYKYVFG